MLNGFDKWLYDFIFAILVLVLAAAIVLPILAFFLGLFAACVESSYLFFHKFLIK
jgi:hypothetical protein